MRSRILLSLLATLALGLTACDGESETPDAGPVMEDGGDSDAGPTSNTVADVISSRDEFSMLTAAVQRVELLGLLSAVNEPAPFTVFAPTNDAFAASGITMEMIEAMPAAQLTGILTYHAIPTVQLDSSTLPSAPLPTAAELTLIVTNDEGAVTLNGGNTVTGGANVVTADIEADNGVVHAIDRVLLPPSVARLLQYAGLTSLAAAVESQGLTEALSDPTASITLFAPTDAAFAALETPPTGDALTEVLQYHVLPARVPSGSIPASSATLATRTYTEGSTDREVALTVFFDTTDGVAINGGSGSLGANVVIPDLAAFNGRVHVVDAVLSPLSIADIATVNGMTSLLAAASMSNAIPAATAGTTEDVAVTDALAGDTLAPLTVLAPTDDAFATAFPSGVPTDGAALLGVLGLHVIPGPLPVRAEDLPADSTPVSPLAGSDLVFDTSADPATVTVTGGASADITATDFGATNGVVHVIDAVLAEGS